MTMLCARVTAVYSRSRLRTRAGARPAATVRLLPLEAAQVQIAQLDAALLEVQYQQLIGGYEA